jgi:hypothetical protein
MPWPLYPWGKCHPYPLDRRLGGPQSQSECCGKEKNSPHLPRIKLQSFRFTVVSVMYTINLARRVLDDIV